MVAGYCPTCGKPRTGERFCANCGKDFWRSAADQRTPANSPAPAAGPDAASSEPNAVTASAGGRRTWILLGVVIFVAVVAAGGFFALANSGAFVPHHRIAGSFTLIDTDLHPSIAPTSSGCRGTGGYGDIRAGAGITLKDGDGKVLATSSLEDSGQGGSSSCAFVFSLADVPEVPFYTIEISHRGEVSYSLSDMQTRDWSLSLSLGN